MKIPVVVVRDICEALREAAMNMVYTDNQRELEAVSVADLVDQVMHAHPEPLVARMGLWMLAQIGGQSDEEEND